MKSLIISIFLLLVLVASPKHAFAEPLPGYPHIEVADVFYAPLFNDTGLFGAFGGYCGGDSGNQIVDWSIGNTIPHNGSMTDDIVFSTSIGSFMNPANWFERMRITKEGNVGIGTASPVDLLEVASDTFAGVTLSTYSSAGADNPSELALRRARGTMASPSAILSGDVIGWIFGDGYGATTWPDIGPGINFVATENWTDTELGSRIGFYTIQNGTNIEVEAMRIDQSGSVGIGTTTPGSGFNTRLDVVGATSLRTNSGDTAKAIVIDLTGTSHRIYSDATSGTPYDLILGTYPNGHMDQLVLQQSTGNVGIGTTSPTAKLTIDTNGLTGDSARRMIKMIPGGSQGRVNIASSIGILDFLQTDVTNNFMDYLALYAKSFNVASSRRWKTNIQPIEGALGKVQRLQGITFDWKTNGKHDIGLIAEEVGAVMPEVVAYEENGSDARSVDYARLVALLIEGMKEQQMEIEELRASVKILQDHSKLALLE